MKPFTAWLAMSVLGGPMMHRGLYRVSRYSNAAWVMPKVEPQRVLVVSDTEENRRKLGMEDIDE